MALTVSKTPRNLIAGAARVCAFLTQLAFFDGGKSKYILQKVVRLKRISSSTLAQKCMAEVGFDLRLTGVIILETTLSLQELIVLPDTPYRILLRSH